MTRSAVAAVVSIGLHAGALLLALGRTAPAPKTAAVAGPRPVQVEVMRLAAVMSPRKPAPAPAPAPAPTARPRSPRAESRGEAAAPPAAAPAPVAVAVEPSPAAPSEEAGPIEPAPAPAPTLDTSALSRRLQEVAARCYPPAARRFHQTGEAEVRFCLDAAGALAETKVSRTSGSELLDRAASGCVVPGAAPFGAETYGRCFTVPVRFHQ